MDIIYSLIFQNVLQLYFTAYVHTYKMLSINYSVNRIQLFVSTVLFGPEELVSVASVDRFRCTDVIFEPVFK